MAKKTKKVEQKKVLTKADILEECKAIESQDVPVQSFNGLVRMQNLTFRDLIQINIDAGDDPDAREAMIVASVCTDLEISDAYKLQTGNGAKFALLYAAVNNFLACRLDNESLGK